MKKICIVIAVILLATTCSINVFAKKPDENSPPLKTIVAKETTLPAFIEESQHLNWDQKGNFLVYIGKTYHPLVANSPLRSTITYHSSNQKILTISETGSITPLNTGVVVIYATQGNVTVGKKLTVKVNPNPVASDKNKEAILSTKFYSYSELVKEVSITDIEQIDSILAVIDTKVPLSKDMDTTPYLGGGCTLKIVRNGVVEEYSFLEVHKKIINTKDPSAPAELESVKNTYGVVSDINNVSTYYTINTDLPKYLFDNFSPYK